MSSDEDTSDIERHVKRSEKVVKKQLQSNPKTISSYRNREVTEKDLQNIAQQSHKKIYSSMGTTCHQCRQKTLDTKTFCRNEACNGVQGQFCGPCLKNRYGENVAETLKNPFWICPYCRDECNCSFCRAKSGKAPTGILVPIALRQGYKSVKHFLSHEKDESNTKSDVTEQNSIYVLTKSSVLDIDSGIANTSDYNDNDKENCLKNDNSHNNIRTSDVADSAIVSIKET